MKIPLDRRGRTLPWSLSDVGSYGIFEILRSDARVTPFGLVDRGYDRENYFRRFRPDRSHSTAVCKVIQVTLDRRSVYFPVVMPFLPARTLQRLGILVPSEVGRLEDRLVAAAEAHPEWGVAPERLVRREHSPASEPFNACCAYVSQALDVGLELDKLIAASRAPAVTPDMHMALANPNRYIGISVSPEATDNFRAEVVYENNETATLNLDQLRSASEAGRLTGVMLVAGPGVITFQPETSATH